MPVTTQKIPVMPTRTLRMSIRLKIIFSLTDLASRNDFVAFNAQNVSMQSKNLANWPALFTHHRFSDYT